MTLTRDHGDIVWQCDTCMDTLETGTRYWDLANNKLKAAHWRIQNDRGEWKHFCTDCQVQSRAPKRGVR